MKWVGRSGGLSTKIHAAVDSYGYPVRLLLREGQRNDVTMAMLLLENIELEGCAVLADKAYDSNALIDYVYERGTELVILSRKGAKFEHRCDWWLYKESTIWSKGFS